jgi:hypothetical protein
VPEYTPGGNPVIEAPGETPIFPVITVANAFVILAPANVPKKDADLRSTKAGFA